MAKSCGAQLDAWLSGSQEPEYVVLGFSDEFRNFSFREKKERRRRKMELKLNAFKIKMKLEVERAQIF